ncbi:MAG: ATP-binding cassette domain-containing protein [Polyangiaceae bacterium]
MTAPALLLDAFGLAFGEKVILADVSLEVPARGVLVLMGPGGAGKSSLLRTLCGANNGNPSLRTWGAALLAGHPIRPGWEPVLVAQKATLLIGTVLENLMSSYPDRASLSPLQKIEAAREILSGAGLDELQGSLQARVIDLPLGLQRRLAVARSAASDPCLLCVDEPTADLSKEEASKLLALLRSQAQRRAVLFVTHNQVHARAAGGSAALLAGGRVHESASTEELLSAPLSRAAQHFVRTGSCMEPSPGTPPEDLEEGVIATPIPRAAFVSVPAPSGPRGFRWARPGKLAGTPRPGIVDDVEYDLEALQRVGITTLVTLEQERFSEPLLHRYGMTGLFFPFRDMSAPEVEAALEHCLRIEERVRAGEVVALHCRAGLGRTGTMIVAQLIYEGEGAVEALEYARRIEPRWVQSQAQIEFLEAFARVVQTHVSQGSLRRK